MRVVLVAFLAGLLFCSSAEAQTDQEVSIEVLQEERDLLFEVANAAAIQLSELQSTVAELGANSPSATEVFNQYNQSQIDHYKYEQDLREHTINVLFWQLFAGWVILILVLGVTGLGIYLSYQEVIGSLGKPNGNNKILEDEELQSTLKNASASEKTELILSLQKIQITSAVTGVVILVLSLGFLYLFVDRVLSLNPLNLSEAESALASSDNSEFEDPESTEPDE